MSKIAGYRKFLGFQYCMSNTNGKIWYFWNHLNNTSVLANDDQHMTLNFKCPRNNSDIFVTAVYAKFTSGERKDLWVSIESTSHLITGPWCMGGDFNFIMDPEEKLGASHIELNR